MKITCDIISDLLPLYAEEMVSSDSKKLIETHLEECPNCQKELQDIHVTTDIPIDINVQGFKQIKTKLFQNKFKAVLFSILLTLIVSVTTINYLTKPNYLPYSEDRVTLTEKENGEFSVSFDESVSNAQIDKTLSEDGKSYDYTIMTSRAIWNPFFNHQQANTLLLNPKNESVKSIYYVSANQAIDTLIYGVDSNNDGGQLTLPRLFLGTYVKLALLGAVFLLILLVATYKIKKVQTTIGYFLLAPVSYVLATFCMKGWHTFSYAPTRDLLSILFIAIPIYGILFLSFDFYKQKK